MCSRARAARPRGAFSCFCALRKVTKQNSRLRGCDRSTPAIISVTSPSKTVTWTPRYGKNVADVAALVAESEALVAQGEALVAQGEALVTQVAALVAHVASLVACVTTLVVCVAALVACVSALVAYVEALVA